VPGLLTPNSHVGLLEEEKDKLLWVLERAHEVDLALLGVDWEDLLDQVEGERLGLEHFDVVPVLLADLLEETLVLAGQLGVEVDGVALGGLQSAGMHSLAVERVATGRLIVAVGELWLLLLQWGHEILPEVSIFFPSCRKGLLVPIPLMPLEQHLLDVAHYVLEFEVELLLQFVLLQALAERGPFL